MVKCFKSVKTALRHNCKGLENGQRQTISVMPTRGGQKTKSQKFDGCPINSHSIGLGLLKTVFEIVVACREGPVPEFCCIAGDIGGGFPKIVFDR